MIVPGDNLYLFKTLMCTVTLRYMISDHATKGKKCKIKYPNSLSNLILLALNFPPAKFLYGTSGSSYKKTSDQCTQTQ